MRVRLLLATGIIALSTAYVPAQDDARFKASSELVVLDVSVTDSHGGFVSGLTQSAFRVFDEGKPEPLSFFAEQDSPATIALLIDASGSMLQNRDRIVSSIATFAEASHPDDEFLPLVFNEQLTTVLPPERHFTNDVAELRDTLTKSLNTRGRTAFHDALAQALDGIRFGRHERKVLIVVSDGGDNASHLTFDEAVTKVLASNVVIYTIALIDPHVPEGNPRAMRRLATMTGGQAFQPGDASMIGKVFHTISADIRNRYTLAYEPKGTNSEGRLRHVRVMVDTPGHRGTKVRTRTGYIAGAPAALNSGEGTR